MRHIGRPWLTHKIRMNDNLAKEIRELRGQGWTYRALKEKFGFSHSYMFRIVHGQAWWWNYEKNNNEKVG